MTELIKKYSILLLLMLIIVRSITIIIIVFYPDILTFDIEGGTVSYPTDIITMILEYILSIYIILKMSEDLKKQNIQSIPILIITFFSSFIGVVFFLLFSAYNKLILQNK